MDKININEFVWFYLTDAGKHHYTEYWETYWKAVKFKTNVPDMNGLIKMQLWTVMEIFGPHMKLGGECGFVDSAIYFKDPSDEFEVNQKKDSSGA